ncbi:MAG: EF-hand domain-containing protein [Burkholderiales bacterium]|jgi:hypothetical protein|nr:EF-hand domain-containing protein [Burkholderiales bacterium]
MRRLSDAVRTATLAAVATLVAAPLAAQTRGSAADQLSAWDRVVMEATFSKADADDDGALTLPEVAGLAGYAERFNDLDTDGNGTLDLEEFAAGFAIAR